MINVYIKKDSENFGENISVDDRYLVLDEEKTFILGNLRLRPIEWNFEGPSKTRLTACEYDNENMKYEITLEKT